MIITKGNYDDIKIISKIFLASFIESVDFLFKNDKPNVEAAKDVLEVFWRFEPDCIWVAREDGTVTGYIIATKSIRNIWIRTIFSGIWLKWILKWIMGKYGFGINPIFKILKNKLIFIRDEKSSTEDKNCGRILSIAVDNKSQGKGISKKLIMAGLNYLKEQGVEYVKLEVRPDNLPAYKAYLSLGFQVVGRMEDLQGPWVIMLKEI